MTERRRPRKADRPAEPAPRRGHPARVAELVPAIGGAAFRRFGFVQSSVVSRWAEIVGPRFADVSRPDSIRFPPGKRAEGVLTLSVDGGHASVIQHVAPTIVERVNRFFGYAAVARVTIRQGAPIARVARRAPPSLRPIPTEIGDSLRAIADPELRACLEGLAGALAANAPAPALAIPLLGKINGVR